MISNSGVYLLMPVNSMLAKCFSKSGNVVSMLTRVVAVGGKTSSGGLLEHELVAILVLEGVGERVEVQGAGKRQGDNEIGGGNEGVSGRVGCDC
jgi:hypothetical protein